MSDDSDVVSALKCRNPTLHNLAQLLCECVARLEKLDKEVGAVKSTLVRIEAAVAAHPPPAAAAPIRPAGAPCAPATNLESEGLDKEPQMHNMANMQMPPHVQPDCEQLRSVADAAMLSSLYRHLVKTTMHYGLEAKDFLPENLDLVTNVSEWGATFALGAFVRSWWNKCQDNSKPEEFGGVIAFLRGAAAEASAKGEPGAMTVLKNAIGQLPGKVTFDTRVKQLWKHQVHRLLTDLANALETSLGAGEPHHVVASKLKDNVSEVVQNADGFKEAVQDFTVCDNKFVGCLFAIYFREN